LNGYQASAGDALQCAATDPVSWPATSSLAAGERYDPAAASPGGSATLSIPMGVAQAKMPAAGTLTATQQSSGGPACATPATLTFGSVTKDSTVNFALPFGTWKLSVKNASTSTSVTSGLKVLASVVGVNDSTGNLLKDLPGASTVSSDTVTLDPRGPKS